MSQHQIQLIIALMSSSYSKAFPGSHYIATDLNLETNFKIHQ